MKKEEKQKVLKYRIWKKDVTISQAIADFLPKEMLPTKKTEIAFGIIFLAVIIIGLILSFFSMGSFFSANPKFDIRIGYPWALFQINAEDPEAIPFKFIELILDMIVYLALAYAIDISINFVDTALRKKNELKEYGLYKIKKTL